MGRLDSLSKLWVPQDVLSNHGPEVRTLRDTPKGLEPTLVVFIVVFAERNFGPFHFLFFFDESFDNVTVLRGRHGQIEYVDVIMIQNLDSIFNVAWFWCIRRKLKIGVCTPF